MPLLRYALVAVLSCFALSALAQPGPPILPGLTGEELRAALMVEYKPSTTLGYNRARDSMFAVVYFEGDGSTGTVRAVYTDWPIQINRASSTAPRTQAFNQGVDTEHTWPQSLGAGSGNARSDLHHLFPTRTDANSTRGNLPFADIPVALVSRWWYLDQSPTVPPAPPYALWSKSSTSLQAFEPRDEHKGRTARAMFYFYTMYAAQSSAAFFEQQAETLYAWHAAFPPDSLERARTLLIGSYQDDRPNPYVLDTSLVRRAFFEEGGGDPDPGPEADFESVYAFDGTQNCDAEDVDAVPQPAHATFSPFTRTGVVCNEGGGIFNSREWPTAGTLDEERYVGFTLTAEDEWGVAFSDENALSFTSRRSGSGPTQGEVRLQVDNGPFETLASWSPSSSDAVTTVSMPDISNASSIAVRFYAWGASSEGGTLRFDNVRLSGSQVAPVSTEPVTPDASVALAVYPNPARVAPSLRFVVPEAGAVSIAVFDVLGRRVGGETLQLEAAEHTLDLARLMDSVLPGGVYVVQVQTQARVVSARFTVVP